MIFRPAAIAASVLVVLAAVTAACTSTLPRAHRNELLDTDSDRLIVVTVSNDTPAAVSRAGSSPRAYDGLLSYSVGSAARKAVASLAHDYGLSEVAAWPIAALQVDCVVFEISATESRAALLAKLSQDARVKIAQPLQTFDTLAHDALAQIYNDPYIGLQHGFEDLDVSEAHVGSMGEGVRVAIIDTGIDTSHPDLKDRIAASRNFVDGDERFQGDRHGTEVAGVIAAVANNKQGIVGVAPGVKIIALKACWEVQGPAGGARCNSFTLAKALAAAIDEHAQIVNLSLTGPADPLLAALIQQGVRRGIIYVGAVAPANNEAGNFPASAANVLAVDMTEGDHDRAQGRTLLAPGREILTLVPDGHYDFATGSSLATANVTGTVALLLAKNRRLSSADIYSLLSRTSSPVIVHDNGRDTERESINACTALAILAVQVECTTVSRLVERRGG